MYASLCRAKLERQHFKIFLVRPKSQRQQQQQHQQIHRIISHYYMVAFTLTHTRRSHNYTNRAVKPGAGMKSRVEMQKAKGAPIIRTELSSSFTVIVINSEEENHDEHPADRNEICRLSEKCEAREKFTVINCKEKFRESSFIKPDCNETVGRGGRRHFEGFIQSFCFKNDAYEDL